MLYLKCKNCGSDKFRQIDKHSFECKYCGVLVRKKFTTGQIDENKQKNEEQGRNNEESTNSKVIEQNIDKKEASKKSKNNFALVKLLICIFLGSYGVHRFMEGKVFTGLIFLFTGGLFGIGYIYDICRLAREMLDNKTNNEIKEN